MSRYIHVVSGGRILYAVEDLPYAHQKEMPWAIRKTHIIGAAENPVRITEEDMKIARESRDIPHPRSEDEIPDYHDRLKQEDLFRNVIGKIAAYKTYSPEGSIARWSMAQFLGHGDYSTLLKSGDYSKAYSQFKWPAARRRVHDRNVDLLVNKNAESRPGQDKHFIMVIGTPGAGKSTTGLRFASKIAPEHTNIDIDRVRAELPEYEGWNGEVGHQEASLLSYGPLIEHAFRNNHHTVYDGSGRQTGLMEETMRTAVNHGYKTHLIYVHRPLHEAVAGTWERFLHNPYGAKLPDEKPSRFVDPFWVHREVGSKPHQTYTYLKTSPLVSHGMRVRRNPISNELPIVEEEFYR